MDSGARLRTGTHRLASVRVALFLLGVLLLPIAAPTAVAWRADGWLSQDVVGGERLRLGDEFGCQGMPGRDVADDLTVIEDCKDYLTSNIEASRWGTAPLSFGIDSRVIDTPIKEALTESGFAIIGDQSYRGDTDGLVEMTRSGGSLEKNIASITDIQYGIEENGYANLYWEAQLEDLNVRRDKEVVAWIEDQPFWFTTWGEWLTASHPPVTISQNSTGATLRGTSTIHGQWTTPGTAFLSVPGANISAVERIDGLELPVLTEADRQLTPGYRLLDNHSVILTIPPQVEVRIAWDGEGIAFISGAHFNNLTPFMATGHHTTDLFEWSKDFQESPIRFTWLIEPQAEIEPTWILPAIAVITILIVPGAVWWTLRTERKADPEEE